MCRQPDSTNQNATFRAFVRECSRELKKYNRTIVFFKYQADEVIKLLPKENISITPVDNYYILNLERKEVNTNGN